MLTFTVSIVVKEAMWWLKMLSGSQRRSAVVKEHEWWSKEISGGQRRLVVVKGDERCRLHHSVVQGECGLRGRWTPIVISSGL